MTTSLPAGADRPAPLLPPSGWRGLARLALEGLAAGLVVSVVLALAVFIVASQAEAAPLHARTAGVVAADAHGGALRLAANGDEPALTAPLVATDIKVAVAGIVARTTLTQRFVNPTGAWREGIYLFPLPEHAAVDHLRVESGGRVIEGQVQERAAAKKRYDDAKRSGRQAGLVEQERPNLFTTSIALLPPHDEVVVTIAFQQTLAWEAGTFHFRLPLAVTPRYVPGGRLAAASITDEQDPAASVEDAERILAPFELDPAHAPVTFALSLDAGFPLESIQSTSHAIRVELASDGRAEVRLADEDVPADRDLELAWTPAVGAEPGAAVFTERRGG